MRGPQATPFVESIHPGASARIRRNKEDDHGETFTESRGSRGARGARVASSPAARRRRRAGTQIDDAAIKTSVKAKLAADVKLSTLTNIEVNSTNGVVTLAGQVDNPDQKRLAAEVARSVDGVVRVNNELQVKGM